MTATVDVGRIQRRALTAHMSDGIFELYLGFVLTFIGIFEALQHFAGGEGFNDVFVPVVVIFPLFMVLVAKRKITRPRIGYVDFKDSRHRVNRKQMALVWAAIVLLAGMVVVLQISAGVAFGGDGEAAEPYVGMYFAIFVSAVLSTLAVMGEAHRWHIGSLVFLAVFAALALLAQPISLGILITGVFLLVVGSVAMVRFLHENPVLPPDEYKGPAVRS